MVKRESFKHLFYIAFALIVLISCWESNVMNAAVVSSEIPQESIRLRILANSDDPQDQWIKREVRDAVVAQMQQWVTGPQSIEEARQVIISHLPEMQQLIGQVLRLHGVDYAYQAELGKVPFPTKMYGNKVYPAGNYEALRVTLGEGKGQNWWCVLFPPLCFIDSVAGEAVANTAKVENHPFQASRNNDKQAQTLASAKPEIHFFLWDLLKKIGSFFH